jgi:hypothetical protein
MHKIFKSLLISLLFINVAHSDILCIKNRVAVVNGRVNLRNKVQAIDSDNCPRGYSLVKDLDTLQDQQIAAFAKVDGAGNVLSFGGSNITSASVFIPSTGRYEITFNGDFDLPTSDDSEQNRNIYTLNSSANADNYGVTNNSVSFASSSQIIVTVFLWRSNNLTDDTQAGVSVSLFKGNPAN